MGGVREVGGGQLLFGGPEEGRVAVVTSLVEIGLIPQDLRKHI